LSHYRLVSIKYYAREEEEVLLVKIPYWTYLNKINYFNANFYFLIENFFDKYSTNLNLYSLNFKNSEISNYSNLEDNLKLLPISSNYSEQDTSFLNDYIYLRNSSFINFFLNNMIDVPICFKKSISLKTKNFELPLLKFSNFLMWEGKREKILHILFKSFKNFFNMFKFNNLINFNEDTNWLFLYISTNNFNLNYYNKIIFNLNYNFVNSLNLTYSNTFFNNEKSINTLFFIKNYLYFLISKVSPIFSYFIYSVDKNIRKFSRGKSGKYTFIWKFIAPYKRIKLATRFIIKDIKFFQSKKFQERLIKTFENLYFFPEKSFSWRSKIFSHNYVFKNFRKSLMSSLKTTS